MLSTLSPTLDQPDEKKRISAAAQCFLYQKLFYRPYYEVFLKKVHPKREDKMQEKTKMT